MKKVVIIILLAMVFLAICQTLIMSAELINKPSTLLFNTGLILFGLQMPIRLVHFRETKQL